MKDRGKTLLRYALAEEAFLEANDLIDHTLNTNLSVESRLYQACVTGIVTSYCRPFTASAGLGSLPPEFRDFADSNCAALLSQTHHQLMIARDKVLAHCDLKDATERFQNGELKNHPGEVVLVLQENGYSIRTPSQSLTPDALRYAKQLITFQIERLGKRKTEFAKSAIQATNGQLGCHVWLIE